ncbi:MAG: hypothetical protein AB9869_19880 [Verrucomicrobiia bacterium]
MNSRLQPWGKAFLSIVVFLLTVSAALGQGDDRFVGVWVMDEGYQVTEFMFRPNGRYQRDLRSTDSDFGYSMTERGRYEVSGQQLTLVPYEYFGEPQAKQLAFGLAGGTLTTTLVEFDLTYVYQFKPGSREEVLANENVEPNLIGTWWRPMVFYGKAEFTFRPNGYYFRKNVPNDGQFGPEYFRGRYDREGNQVTLKPYSSVEMPYELDFFGNTLTLIRKEQFSGDSETYELYPGSREEVAAKAAEAEAFLSRENWQVGLWEIRDGYHVVDLTLRPDGHYISTNSVELLRGIVRGRYTLEPGQIHLFPFVGQEIYSRDNGDFGKVDRTRAVDYYDGELQLINLEALSQDVALARKVPGSEAAVLEKARLAQEERAREGWQIGVWQVNDPTGWMEFTFRPDNRYIAKSGAGGVAFSVERGQYVVRGGKITLAPYSGEARGFDLDLYDGDLYLVGDWHRMVIARKNPGSESEVIEKTTHPTAMDGERGSILGLWTANMPGENVALVFRPDGHFRQTRCANDTVSEDYGLYTVDMTTRTLVVDSRFSPVQTHGLDFYGDTMTIYGGLGQPKTYTVNLGIVDQAVEASLAADAQEALVDAQWLARVPIVPRDPKAVQVPVGNIPADPNPGVIFEDPTVLKSYQMYRRLIGGFVYFNDAGTIKSVPVVNTREWHFFPTGRVLVRFTNHRAGLFYPMTEVDISDLWGAYTIGGKPEETDILHVFADNSLFLETDLGERVEMTLEDGRRNLFWGKDYQILSEWAAERKPAPCELPADPDSSLINTGVDLDTEIAPDSIGNSQGVTFRLSRPESGSFTLSGTAETAGNIVTERASSLVAPVRWEAIQTNSVTAGPFSFRIPQGPHSAAFFRLRQQ